MRTVNRVRKTARKAGAKPKLAERCGGGAKPRPGKAGDGAGGIRGMKIKGKGIGRCRRDVAMVAAGIGNPAVAIYAKNSARILVRQGLPASVKAPGFLVFPPDFDKNPCIQARCREKRFLSAWL